MDHSGPGGLTRYFRWDVPTWNGCAIVREASRRHDHMDWGAEAKYYHNFIKAVR